MRLDCECGTWADEWCLNTGGHHHNCPKYSRREELAEVRKTLLAVAHAMEDWGSEEDGIPEFAWPAYERLCRLLFLPVPEVNDD